MKIRGSKVVKVLEAGRGLVRLFRVFCKHDFVLDRLLYGDEVLRMRARKVFRCTKCGKLHYGEINE